MMMTAKGFHLVICLLYLATTVSTRNSFYTTVDHRYPPHIVNDARVKCPREGSYPHPADCSWYYRCHDKFELGVFQVFYFKCEPGTVFHDELDQCVWGNPVHCGSASGSFPPTGPSPPPLPPTPFPSPPATPGPPAPPTPPPPAVTSGTEDPDTTPVSITIPPTTPEAPTTPEETAPPLTTTTIAPTLGGTSTTTECNRCENRLVCPGALDERILTICATCKYGSIVNHKTPSEACPYYPEPVLLEDGRCMATQDICTSPIVMRQDQTNKLDEYSIQCSDHKVRPDSPKIRELLCQQYHYCTRSGSYLISQNLCKNYLQCSKSRFGSWQVELKSCLGPNLYNYELDQCVPEPNEADIC